ncbi:MAG: hypothetical protein V2A79_20285 [Planctomycetota bacterium]
MAVVKDGIKGMGRCKPQLPEPGMFERFADWAPKVMALANQEARRLDHDYIVT